ncbi:hypothetical protein ARMGADRAFT_1036191 [Armillaria gallica]|uniref:Uncharacterized protein n=1 Tax=Armillaria gallica TaxID=47427 RepID=A0A2H3D9M0_ARMGA|nr:hypothetical protein ARMGADRAFT_1036191 [Armillaria gallica]
MSTSVATTTVLPREQVPPPAPPSTPHPSYTTAKYRLRAHMDELSEEEHELEEMVLRTDNNIHIRGFKTIGRVKTQQEKQEPGRKTMKGRGNIDLDATMEDLDMAEFGLTRCQTKRHAAPMLAQDGGERTDIKEEDVAGLEESLNGATSFINIVKIHGLKSSAYDELAGDPFHHRKWTRWIRIAARGYQSNSPSLAPYLEADNKATMILQSASNSG